MGTPTSTPVTVLSLADKSSIKPTPRPPSVRTLTPLSSGSQSFTATVSVVSPGAGTPGGNVEFYDGAVLLGTGSLSGGTASFSTASLSVATHSITAKYVGNGNFNSSTSTALSQVVNKANTTTSVSSNANPSAFGQSVTFTATVSVVSPGAGTPTGTVDFKDGATLIGTGTLSGGTASVSTSSLSVGTHTITAVYSGDGNFNGSNGSLSGGQVVNKADTSTTVASNHNPSVFGQSVTFTATVSAVSPGAGTPTGTVDFKDGATTLASGVSLSGGMASFSTSSLSVATHSITAVYSGDGNFHATGETPGSTATALSQVVNKADTTTSVTSDVNPSTIGQTVTFTATVSVVAPGAGTPTGTVDFKDGATLLGTGTVSGGTASFSTSSLSAGNHSITAVYSGDGNFNGSTSPEHVQHVHYTFIGFFQPIDNLPIVNSVKAGSVVPVKWQLKDFAGNLIGDLSTLATPNGLTSSRIACDTLDPMDDIEELVPPGSTLFRFDGTQFIYNWQTLKSWAGTCRLMTVTLADGTTHSAQFKFK
jgi:hypothetical protein